MTVRKAVADDLDGLCGMVQRFSAETDLPLTFSQSGARETMWAAIHNKDAIVLLWDSGGVLAGAVMGYVGRDVFKELVAYVTRFYVEREFRGTVVARELLNSFDNQSQAQGARISFASATAGFGERNEKLFVRLFEKCGYNVLGRVLEREYP